MLCLESPFGVSLKSSLDIPHKYLLCKFYVCVYELPVIRFLAIWKIDMLKMRGQSFAVRVSMDLLRSLWISRWIPFYKCCLNTSNRGLILSRKTYFVIDRWVRSEGCRHAALLVGGAMFLLELPAEAVLGDSWRQANDAQRTSSSTTGSLAKSLQPAPSSTLPSTEHRPMRGWWLKIVAHSLQSLSVPMAKAEVELACNDKNVGGTGGRVPVGGDARGGLIIHTRNSSCAWVECESASRRDDLVQLIAAWHSAETKGRALKVCYLPQCEALDKVRASNGAAMRSLLSERKTCSW